MPKKETLTFIMLDPSCADARTHIVLKLINIAIEQGHDVKLFASRGTFLLSNQMKSVNDNRNCEIAGADMKNHSLLIKKAAELFSKPKLPGRKFDWVKCNIHEGEKKCLHDFFYGVRNISSQDVWSRAASSKNTLVVASR